MQLQILLNWFRLTVIAMKLWTV